MVLYLIGLGLGDEQDITLRGLKTVRGCKRIYLEAYTAVLLDAYSSQKPASSEQQEEEESKSGEGLSGIEKLKRDMAKLYECQPEDIVEADRFMVEQQSDVILKDADKVDVAFLVVGDALAATTHADLMLRARQQSPFPLPLKGYIPTRVIYNASIMNACAACGLQLYSFGQTVSIVFFDEEWRPDSFYDRVKSNRDAGLHTLCLLDIKVKEQSKEHMSKDIQEFQPARFMTVNQCVAQLLEIEELRGEKAYSAETLAFGMARVGQDSEQIVSGHLKDLLNVDFGAPLHSVVICGPELHDLEQDMVDLHWHDPAEAKRLAEERRELAEKARELAHQASLAEAAEQRELAKQRLAEIAARKEEEKARRLAEFQARQQQPAQSDSEDEPEVEIAIGEDDMFMEFM